MVADPELDERVRDPSERKRGREIVSSLKDELVALVAQLERDLDQMEDDNGA